MTPTTLPMPAASPPSPRVRARRVPYVPQVAAADCSAACLAMALAYHGRRALLEDLRLALGTGHAHPAGPAWSGEDLSSRPCGSRTTRFARLLCFVT